LETFRDKLKKQFEESLAEVRRLNSAYRVRLYESQSGLDVAVEWAKGFQQFGSSSAEAGEPKEAK